jgi:hypothetical protein
MRKEAVSAREREEVGNTKELKSALATPRNPTRISTTVSSHDGPARAQSEKARH